ncbi:MAG: hypothetical protein ACRD2A_26740 [Vicinamibacterales bacterium]
MRSSRATSDHPSEYMTTREAGELLRLSPKSLRNKIALGIFREGVHYHTRRGIGLRWLHSALVDWLAGTDRKDESENDLPLAQPGGRRVA